MTISIEAYNVSSVAFLFNYLPRLRLTPDGLLPYRNITFDYTNSSYINSLIVTFFASPFALLFLIFCVYIIFITLISYRSQNKEYSLREQRLKCLQKLQTKNHLKNISFNKNHFDCLDVERIHQQQVSVSNQQCKQCRIFWIVMICLALVTSIMGVILLLQGTLESDSILREINFQSIQSKESIGTFSRRYLPGDSQNKTSGFLSRSMHALFSRSKTYNTMKLYANKTTIDASQANAQWFEQQFFLNILFYASTNILTILILSIFWFLLIILSCVKIHAKSLLIYCMLSLILITFMFSLSLTSGVALSDFCLKAKPIIADITVNKMPENNFTTSFVNYYLHCNLNEWNLDKHKKSFFTVLSGVDRAISINAISSLFNNVKSGIEASFDTLHCAELNGLINDGLSEFCQKPIEAFSYLTISYSIFYFVFTLILFVITFWV